MSNKNGILRAVHVVLVFYKLEREITQIIMDALDLLAREDEFKKLNKQLQKKTDSLMKEIEFAMQKPDIFSEFSQNLTLSPNHTYIKKHCCDTLKVSTPEHNTPIKTKNVAKRRTNAKDVPNNGPKPCSEQTSGFSSEVDNGTEYSTGSNCISCVKRVNCDCCVKTRNERVNDDLEFLYAFVSVNVQEKVLPQSFLKDRATVESVCKFMSSKVKLMQEQIDKLQAIVNKKASQCEVHLTHQAELEGERMTLLNKNNKLTSSTADMKAKCLALQKKLEEKDHLYKEQRSETDKLTSESKRLKSKNVSLEARCAFQEEAMETLKHQVEAAKRAEKEFRDSTRSLSASHQSAISRLETRVKSLTTRIDKQSELIDNLRRQNALLATEGAVKALEREYCSYLTQD